MTSDQTGPGGKADAHREARSGGNEAGKRRLKEQPGPVARVLAFFDSATKVLLAIGGLIAAITALWAGIAQLNPATEASHPRPTTKPGPSISRARPGPSHSTRAQVPPQVAATLVDKCETQHRLSQQHQTVTRSATTTDFDSCIWPAPSYADADGFTQIKSRLVSGPGPDDASGTDWVSRITGPCKVFSLAYDFGFEGGFTRLASFSAPAGLLTSLSNPGKEWPGKDKYLGFYPARDEVDVLHNSDDVLSQASCQS